VFANARPSLGDGSIRERVANVPASSFTGAMQSELSFTPGSPPSVSRVERAVLTANGVRVVFVRNPRARRYILRLQPDGTARVTIPRRGSAAEAREFFARQSGWLEAQLERRQSEPARSAAWHIGSAILFRGERVHLESDLGTVRFGSERLGAKADAADLRPLIEAHLWKLASRELPLRLLEYSRVHGLAVGRVTVRNQRTRWGSCSRRGTISLNWRLIQTPPFVRDYICLHELMHLREMNHSPRFWREVEAACPYYMAAERWLKANARLLH